MLSILWLLLGCPKNPDRPQIDTSPIEVHQTYVKCERPQLQKPVIRYSKEDHLGGLTSVRKTYQYLSEYEEYSMSLYDTLLCYERQANSTEEKR